MSEGDNARGPLDRVRFVNGPWHGQQRMISRRCHIMQMLCGVTEAETRRIQAELQERCPDGEDVPRRSYYERTSRQMVDGCVVFIYNEVRPTEGEYPEDRNG